MTTAAAAGPFDAPYHHLASLPTAVWLPTLVCAVGTRELRLAHGAQWLQTLQQGQLPADSAHFGDPPACAPLRHVVAELGLPKLARDVPELANQVLRSLLWHLDRLLDLQPRLSRAAAIEQITQDFRAAWPATTQGLAEAMTLLRELASADQLHWDSLPGLLRSRAWQTARRAAQQLLALPAVAELLRRVGRSEPRETAPPAATPQLPANGRRTPLRAVQTHIPGAPGELTGVRLSASIEHMLASETTLLLHPVGRRLWRARHAEGRLLAHDTTAVLTDWRLDPQARPHSAAPAPAPQDRQRGPLILCLDTSGSMRGAPEHIAKAVVIAAVQVARAEGRGCQLIAFGGAGEVMQRELSPHHSQASLQSLLEIMALSFDGGTDIQTPIEQALSAVQQAAWHSADLVLVSDGEFGCVASTLDSLDQARQTLGLRVYGVLVGDRETMGLMEVCDEIHWVRDWRRHRDPGAAPDDESDRHDSTGHDGTGRGGPAPHQGSLRVETLSAQPVHSKSLTALYFPGALSARAQRHLKPT